ncbi:MAG: glycosyltransferase [Nitrososphaeraceae archaeon]
MNSVRSQISFFTSPIGLGHATRDLAIAQKILLNTNEINIKFITGSSAYKFLSESEFSTRDLYDPPNFIIKNGKLDKSFLWLIKYFLYYKKCKDIAKTIIDSKITENNLILSDEDFASISVAKDLDKKRILITDVLSTDFTKGIYSLFEKKMNQKMKQIIKNCNYVIIPDYGQDIDNIKYVGPIVRDISETRDVLRKKFKFNKKTVILSIGGTNSGKFLIDRTIQVFKKLRKKLDIDLVISSGPSLKMKPYECFRYIGYVNNLNEYIFAADLVISLAGRSTMDEALIYETPGIFIPIKNHFEQEKCAKRLGYEFEDVYRLDNLIEEKVTTLNFENNKPRLKIKQNNGAQKAVSIISRLL